MSVFYKGEINCFVDFFGHEFEQNKHEDFIRFNGQSTY